MNGRGADVRAGGLEEPVHVGLGDLVHPRVTEHLTDRIGRGAAKQSGRVRRRGQLNFGTDRFEGTAAHGLPGGSARRAFGR
jgi:hypothetical protein